ncbi:hypothetical protein H5410_059490 [Solanum commersonii]|uniref:Uncharacterized protein n=1 Tax=Solanum commersonii TaxID=4109 RepID=A0A9J5W346_SOLCO|nr:hypothetical protein H5410_059490 [Solanum commersonii]
MQYGHNVPNLQICYRVQSLTCKRSGCERNWACMNINTIDPILLDNIDEANEWLTEHPKITKMKKCMKEKVSLMVMGSTLRGNERGARGSSSSRNLVDEPSDDEEDDDQVEPLVMALEEFEDLVEE